MANILQVPEIKPNELINELNLGHKFLLLDCREHYEWQQNHLVGSFHVPMGDLPNRLSEIERNADIIVICAHGERSRIVAGWLNQQGYSSKSLHGGLAAWPQNNQTCKILK